MLHTRLIAEQVDVSNFPKFSKMNPSRLNRIQCYLKTHSKQSQEIFETRKLCWDQFPGSCLNASLPVNSQRHGSSTAIQGRRCHLCHHMQSTLPLPRAPAPPLEDLPWSGWCRQGGGQGAPRVCGDRGYKGCVLALRWLWGLGVHLWIWQKKSVSYWLAHPTVNHLLSAEWGPDLTSEMLPGPRPQCSPGSQPGPWAPHC